VIRTEGHLLYLAVLKCRVGFETHLILEPTQSCGIEELMCLFSQDKQTVVPYLQLLNLEGRWDLYGLLTVYLYVFDIYGF
jgi:hypothetical protein